MKANRTISVCLIILLLAVVAFAGCSQMTRETEVIDLALVVDPTAGNPIHDLSPAEDWVAEACRSYGSVSLVLEDGAPVVHRRVFQKPEAGEMSVEASLDCLAREQAELLLFMAESMTPVTAETDTLEAISRAASAVRAGEGRIKRIVIFSSGVSTKGYVSFLEGNIAGQSPEEIAGALAEQSALPDLEGVEVHWFNIGVTGGDQPPLTAQEKAMLQKIWDYILRSAGAEVVFHAYPVQQGVRSTGVPVTPVPAGEIRSVTAK